ncbi:class I SAM-dependent methyltransferase [Corallococcus sp. AB030]|uniref:class I SAM-dependent methyltransferase n=1 Tax=Corallococcus sp. AB030 TaxID=2316716 RepID=UPI000EEFB047|nr:class I SAM-dependent methyltransferase [Corallococcus sp. AB030]RKI20562.1 class I SAM-dependent methyltransferase [Corallococcus sp. AB030]
MPSEAALFRGRCGLTTVGCMDNVATMTERLLADAGLRAGMRVRDVGCGRGDVTFMAASQVGTQGQVVGVDRDSGAIEQARVRAREQGLSNVTFVEGDLHALPKEQGLFDAVVGRRVLMYQADAVDAVRSLARAVKPGGLVVFQEHDSTVGPVSLRPLPLHAQVREWIWRTVEREGANVHMGFDLASVFTQAGLTVEQVRAVAVVQTPTQAHPTGAIVRAMIPRIVKHGVATEAELDVDTLEQRLTEERVKAGATYIGELAFGAWARVPG